MVDQIAFASFTSSAITNSTVDITSPNLTETFKAAIIAFTAFNTDDSAQLQGKLCLGFIGVDTGSGYSTNAVASYGGQNALATVVNAGHGSDDDACLQILANNVGSVVMTAVFDSVISNGVRIRFPGATNFAAKGSAILFGGLSRAAAGNCTSSPGGTAELVGDSASRFSPDVVIFLSADTQSDVAVANGDGCVRMGFALNKAGLPQICAISDLADGSDPQDAAAIIRTDSAWSHFEGVRTGPPKAQVTSFDASGFTVSTDGTSPQALYLALKWADASRVRTGLANMAVSAATGRQDFNALGFTPDALIGIGTLIGSLDSLATGSNSAVGGYMLTGRHGSRAVAVSHNVDTIVDGTHPTIARTIQGDHALQLMNSAGVVALQADWLGSTGSGGFALNFTTASQAGYMTALGIQIIPDRVTVRRPRILLPKRSRLRRRRVRLVTGASFSSVPARLWQALGRIRRAAQQRLRWRPRLVFHSPTQVVPQSVFDQEPAGTIYSAGSARGEVGSGGAEAGRVS